MNIPRWGAPLAGGAATLTAALTTALALAGPAAAYEPVEEPRPAAPAVTEATTAPEPSTDLEATAPETTGQQAVPEATAQEAEQEATAQDDTGLTCVDVNTADAETLMLLRHIDEDRAGQILELRPFSSVNDLDRVQGLAADGPRLAELVAGGGDWLPLCPIAAEEGAEEGVEEGVDELPLTGSALPLLLVTGLALAGAGAGAVVLARRRRRVFTAA